MQQDDGQREVDAQVEVGHTDQNASNSAQVEAGPTIPTLNEVPGLKSKEEPATPAAKARGRPRKTPTAAPKQAVRMKKPPLPPAPSEDEEEPLDKDDMETLLLDYLVRRKESQQTARRALWSQLAGLS